MYSMRKIGLISVIFLIGNASFAQQNLDSIWTIWQDETNEDSLRLKAIKEYTWNKYLFKQPDSGFHYSQLMYDLAEEKNLPFFKTKALNMQGISFMIQSDYNKAIDYYTTSFDISEKIGDKQGMANVLSNISSCYKEVGNYPKAILFNNRSLSYETELGNKKGIAQSLNNIGIIHKLSGEYPKALDNYFKSLQLKEELGDKKGVANSLNNIGIIYRIQEDHSNALEYYLKSLALKEEINDKSGIGESLNNIGGLYFIQGDLVKAEDYFLRSLKSREELGDKSGIASSLGNLGVLYDEKGMHTKALTFHLKGLKLRQEIDNKQGIAESMINTGESFILEGDYRKAISWCDRARLLASQIGILGEHQMACDCLYKSYKALNQGIKALTYLETSLAITDSLKAEETAIKLQQMEFSKQMLADSLAYVEEAFTTELAHQKEIRKKEKTKNISIAGGLFILLMAGGLWSRLNYIRKSREEIRKEKDRSENLLLNILPAEVAEELKEKGEAAARDFDRVSILFTDFKEFTQLSEQLSAQELVSEINHCFKAFDAICAKHQIEKIKTIGDSYMAAGGLPVPDKNSAKNLVLAALDMADFVVQRREERLASGKLPFTMRAGIHTGPVVAGIVGVKKFQYDIWGDTVNTASRMESHGEIGTVNISHSTYEIIKDDAKFKFNHRGKLEVKGKGEVDMYFVSRK